MEFVKRNKGVIVFYLLIALATLVVIQSNERNLKVESNYVYLER